MISKYFLTILLLWNLITFFMMGIDKLKAIKGKRRISEKKLLTSALFLGSFGAILGIYIFRHKTRKKKFKIVLPLTTFINAVITLFIVYKLK